MPAWRDFLLHAVGLALAAALGAAHAGAPAPSVGPLVPLQVGPHSYYVQGHAGVASAQNQGFNSNAGFVITDEGVVVVDALGTPSLGHALIAAIRKLTTQPIKRVVLTHYHADHMYGLQAFKEIGAEIWAQRRGTEYLEGPEGANRLAQRRRDLAPWVDEATRLLPADRWLDEEASFTMGGLHFELIHMGPAHSPDDLMIAVREDGVIYSGDIIFTGRVPFVGEADSRQWLSTIDRLLRFEPRVLVTGHGAASRQPSRDLALTRDYLAYLRDVMSKAVENFTPFDAAYAATDWSRFDRLPAFEAANRINAYGTYLLMEKESLQTK